MPGSQCDNIHASLVKTDAELAEVEARLAKLGELTGTGVVLGEMREDPIEQKEADAPDNTAWQAAMMHDAHQDQIAEVNEDAPQMFMSHDAGPRPPTFRAFDSSKFFPGEPVDKDIEFCPWNVVKGYPKNFTGKTNRPHVNFGDNYISTLFFF